MRTLTAVQVKEMLLLVGQHVIAAKDLLSEADRNIGDGDHGIGMANGFEAVQQELTGKDFSDVYSVFSTVGRTMIRVMGGASGIIFGLLFFAGAKNMAPKAEMTTEEFARMFQKALEEIQAKGQAKPGDKTLIDGLMPMTVALTKGADEGLDFEELLVWAVAAAEAGKEASKQYVAKFGKAKTLGERAIGYPDAGCVTLTVIANAMHQWAQINTSKLV